MRAKLHIVTLLQRTLFSQCFRASVHKKQAGVAKLADARDLGSRIARCAGSSPVSGTHWAMMNYEL
jgi:hypothetical protein